jgi:hypothetical protein
MAKTSASHKKKRSSKKRYGGNCGMNGSSWTSQVVGNYPHVAQAGSNVIMSNVPAANTSCMSGGNGANILTPGSVDVLPSMVPAPTEAVTINTPGTAPFVSVPMVGGKKKRSNKRKGGDLVTELAVPAILLVANQTIGKKTGKKYAFPKKRFSKRRNTRFNRRR